VSDGVLLEVKRGDALTVAQQFTLDWDGPICSMVHGAVMTPAVSKRVTPSPCPPTRHELLIACIVFAVVFVLGALVGLGMANVLRKW